MPRIDQLLNYLREDPKDPFLNYALALEYLKMNNLQEAEQLLSRLVVDDPGYLAAYYQWGRVLEQLHRRDDAVKAYKSGIEVALQEKNQHTLNELKAALLNLEDPEEE